MGAFWEGCVCLYARMFNQVFIGVNPKLSSLLGGLEALVQLQTRMFEQPSIQFPALLIVCMTLWLILIKFECFNNQSVNCLDFCFTTI